MSYNILLNNITVTRSKPEMRSDNVIMAGVLGEGELWLWPVSGPGLHQSTLWLRQSHLSHRGQSQSHGTTPGTSVALHQTRPESRWYCTWSTHWLHTLSLCHRWCSSPQHRTRKLTISEFRREWGMFRKLYLFY